MVFSKYFDERDKNTGEPWWSFAQEREIDAASMALGAAWAEHVERQRDDEKRLDKSVLMVETARPTLP